MDPCRLLNVRRIDNNCISVVAGDQEIHLTPDELLRHANRFYEDVKGCINNAEMGGQAAKDCSPDSLVDELKARLKTATLLIHRYRTETPLGYQPHMIAEKADHWLLANAEAGRIAGQKEDV